MDQRRHFHFRTPGKRLLQHALLPRLGVPVRLPAQTRLWPRDPKTNRGGLACMFCMWTKHTYLSALWLGLHSTFPLWKEFLTQQLSFFENMHFSQTKIVSYPPKAGLIEYWLEELLVAASKEGEEGGRRKVQQQQVKILSLRSLSLMIWRYKIITDFFTFPLILETRRT